MNKNFVLMLAIFPMVLGMEGIMPLWGVLVFTIPILFVLIYDIDFRHRRGLFLITGGIMIIIAIFPMIMSQSMNTKITNSTNSNSNTTSANALGVSVSSTTVCNSGIFSIFLMLLPVLIGVSIVFHFLHSMFEGEHYDDGGATIRHRGFRGYYQYDYTTEQSQFEKEILDMDLVFKKDT